MALTEQATEAQIEYIQSLIREHDTDLLTELQRTWLESKDFSTLTRGGASRVIDALSRQFGIDPICRGKMGW